MGRLAGFDAPHVVEVVVGEPDRAEAGRDAVTARADPLPDDLVRLRLDLTQRCCGHRDPDASRSRSDAAAVAWNGESDRRYHPVRRRVDVGYRAVALIERPDPALARRDEPRSTVDFDPGRDAVVGGIDPQNPRGAGACQPD